MSELVNQLRAAAKISPLWSLILETAADEVDRLQRRENHLVNVGSVNKLKADAVLEAAEATKTNYYVGNEKGCSYPELIIHANKLKRGEL